MKIKKVASVILVAVAASYAQQTADTSSKQIVVQQQIVASDSNKEPKGLNKQLGVIKKNPTTWSKIKDMFM
jgi:hypothetical protein